MSIGFATLSHQSLFLTRPANDADTQYGAIPVRYLAVSRRSKVMTSRDLRIGIGCIGSGVGQSVINSCRLTRLRLHTIGLGTNPLAFGLYACDDYAYIPRIYHRSSWNHPGIVKQFVNSFHYVHHPTASHP